MPAPLSDEDYKRRARRRLIGAVALTIVAVIILPLVLQNEPPPAGPLEVHMPSPSTVPEAKGSTVEYAPPPSNAAVEPPAAEDDIPAASMPPSGQNRPAKTANKDTAKPVPAKPAEQASKSTGEVKSGSFTVQVGVFADKANVQRLQSRIASLGMNAYIDQVGQATRIRVGTFSTKSEADAVAAKLAAAGVTGSKVVEK